jgi:hypothetical protein
MGFIDQSFSRYSLVSFLAGGFDKLNHRLKKDTASIGANGEII